MICLFSNLFLEKYNARNQNFHESVRFLYFLMFLLLFEIFVKGIQKAHQYYHLFHCQSKYDLQSKSMNWFLYDSGLRLERVKYVYKWSHTGLHRHLGLFEYECDPFFIYISIYIRINLIISYTCIKRDEIVFFPTFFFAVNSSVFGCWLAFVYLFFANFTLVLVIRALLVLIIKTCSLFIFTIIFKE